MFRVGGYDIQLIARRTLIEQAGGLYQGFEIS